MIKNNVEPLPVWKKNATAEERLQELAHMARKNPEQFNKFIVIFQEFNERDDTTYERQMTHNMTTTEALGMLTFGEVALLRDVSSQ